MIVNKRAFFKRTVPIYFFLLSKINEFEYFFFRRDLPPLASLPHGDTGMVPTATTLALALAATHRMINRIARHAARNTAPTSQRLRPALPSMILDVIGVADLPDCTVTLTVDQTKLTYGILTVT